MSLNHGDISTFGVQLTMSYYYKLILIVIVGSVASWFAVQKLVTSTTHIARGLTVNTIDEFALDSTPRVPQTRDQAPAESMVERVTSAEPAAENVAKNRSSIGSTDSSAEAANPADSDVAANSESDNQEAVRADSDADMQAENETQKQEQPVKEQSLIITTNSSSLESTSSTSSANSDQTKSPAAAIKKAPTNPSNNDADNTATNNANTNPPKTNLPVNERKIQPLALNTTLASAIEPGNIKPAKPKAIKALDLAYAVPPESACKDTINGEPRVGILYRPTSFAIKGQSLTDIDKLIGLYKKCGGKLQILENSLSAEESEQRLIQLRQDEVKYYLLQRRVSKEDMIFPDNS